MGRNPSARFHWLSIVILALALAAGAGITSVAPAGASTTPSIPVWAFPGAFRDSSLIFPNRCLGTFKGPLPDSIRPVARAVTVRFLRNRVAEKQGNFGGYRIYRMTNQLDSTKAVLVRRFSINAGSELTWNFSRIDTAANSFAYVCKGAVVNDSVVTFVDPDSSGDFVKICRRPGDFSGRCFTPGDSVLKLFAPPGPHD